MVLRALVAVEQPLPVDLLSSVASTHDGDLTALLSRLELDGLIEWQDDATIVATDEAVASTRLTRADRAKLRGEVGRAAWLTRLPVGLVASWVLDGCSVTPDAAVPSALLDRADRAVRAGDLAAAADVLEQVIAAVERGTPVALPDRVRAYARLGYVLRWLGRWEDAAAIAARALAIARESREPVALAVAAIAWRPDGLAVSDDPSTVVLVDEALSVVDPSEALLRSRLLAARAEALLFTELQVAQDAATEALALARASGDDETFLAVAYAYRIAHWHPSRQAEMFGLGTEMVRRGATAVDHAEYGPLLRLQVFLETGDWAHFDNEVAAMVRRVSEAPRPFERLWLQVVQAARAQTRGEWEKAAELIGQALTVVSGPEHGSAFQLLLTQQVLAGWHAGDDLRDLVALDVLPAGPMRASWDACLLGWTCHLRDRDDVERSLDLHLERGIDSVRPDLTFGPVTSSLAMAAAEIGSTRHALVLFDALAPFAEQWAGTGGAVVNGPFALHLGRLATVLGRTDEADRLLSSAQRSATAGGCTPWLARIHLARAEAAEGRARLQHASEAAALAEGAGMQGVAAAARQLVGRHHLPHGLTDREAEVLRLLATGATNTEIAATTYLSVKTVERHLLNAYRKAGVRNRAEATAFALRELGGMVQPPTGAGRGRGFSPMS